MVFEFCRFFYCEKMCEKMSLSEEEIRMLFRVTKTLNHMLKDRGYIVTDAELEMTQEQFIDKYGENMERKDLVTIKTKKKDESDKVCGYQGYEFLFLSVFFFSILLTNAQVRSPCGGGRSLSFFYKKQKLKWATSRLALSAWYLITS